jgi:hypothetical protein
MSDTPERDEYERLARIRKRYDYMVSAWKEIREQAELDQRAQSIAGPWEPGERDERTKNGRPCVHLDQLTQYVSALVNQVRSEPIAIKVSPSGEGSSEDTAELRAKRIRAIEYESNAQQAYQSAFESAASMSFGAFGITIDYKSWDSMQRIIKFRRFANPWSIIWDPDCKEADSSDMRDCFILTREPREDFERNHPDATITSFGDNEVRLAPTWFDDDSVQVAEYWYRELKRRRVMFIESDRGPQRLFGDEVDGFKIKGDIFTFKDGSIAKLLDDRKTDQPLVKMLLTNGVEILDETDWPGKEIPIVPVVGRERYIRVANKVKRELHSYVRYARDGQMMFDYYKSNEAEIVGMTPKTPYIGYKGQFVEDYWESIHKIPRAFAEVEPILDGVSQVLPLPQRNAYEPPVQALEMGAEAARRAIQAAVASYGVTRLDDTNVKSGIALKQLDAQRDLGSYHLVDNYKIAIRRAGRIVNDLLDDVESDPMQVSVRGLDDEQEMVSINQPGPGGEPPKQYRLTEEGQHEVTLSTGPNFQSQHEEGTQLNDSIVANIDKIAAIAGPEKAVKLFSLSIQNRQVGPLGDKMVEILEPDPKGQQQQIPPQVQQAMQQAQQQNQALNAYAKQLEAQLQEYKRKAEGKDADNETKRQIAALQADVDMFKIRMDAMKAHEQMTSDENIANQRMVQEHRHFAVEADQAEVDQRINAMTQAHDMDMAERQAETQQMPMQPETME